MNTLILNLGLKSIRSIVLDEYGEKLAQDWLPVKTVLKGSFVEQDPNEWWDLAKEAIQRTTVDKSVKDAIEYITVTAPSCCLVLLDKKGDPLANAIMVADKRAHDEAVKLKNDKSTASIFAHANNLAEANFMFPKILWFKKYSPQIFEKVDKFVSANDFLIYRLTGRIVTDYLNAEKFYYNHEKGVYPQEMIEKAGISLDSLPRVVDIGSSAGKVKDELCRELGLNPSLKVIVTTYDAICAFWGAGVSEEGQACNVCGTSSSLRVYSKTAAANKENGILSQFFKDENMYIVGGSNNLEGGLLEWAKGCFYGDSYFSMDKFIYNVMEEEAMRSTIGAGGMTFLPYLIGERVPFWDPHVRGVFFGIERSHSRKDIMRSIFESTGFCALSMVQAIESCGVPVKNIRISGGLARINFICRLRADITGKDILVLDEFETTAIGAFTIIARANKMPVDFNSIIKVKKEIKPDPESFEKYQKLYELYMDVYRSLFDTFRNRTDALKFINQKDEPHSVENL